MNNHKIKKSGLYFLKNFLKKALVPGVVMILGFSGVLGFAVTGLAGCKDRETVSGKLEEVSLCGPEEAESLSTSEEGNRESMASDVNGEEGTPSGDPELLQNSSDIRHEGETAGECVVYVCGAVVQPGVYAMPAGSRIEKAVAMAGGFTSEACTYYLNLAQIPEDGMQIYVPTQMEVDSGTAPFKGGASEGASEAVGDGLVNINTADMEELMTLPGIGDSRARSIIAYRNEHGAFSSVEELKNISGIKEATFSKIKDYIRI